MTITDKTVLVTGANRGIGQALVAEALSRGVKRVYAATRRPVTHSDSRVTPVTLDVTNAAQIRVLADLTREFGVGYADITTRQQIQLRGFQKILSRSNRPILSRIQRRSWRSGSRGDCRG